MSPNDGAEKKEPAGKYYFNEVMRSLEVALKPLLWGVAGSIAAILLSIFLSSYNNVPFSYLSRDTAAIVEQPIFIGFLSNLGMVVWAFTVGFCLLGHFMLRNSARKKSRFLLYAGALTILLLIDDLFLIHEKVMPHVLNISGKIWFLLYVVAVAGLLRLFYREILRTNYFLLLFAFGFFAISILFDVQSIGMSAMLSDSPVAFHSPGNSAAGDLDHNDLLFLIEDGSKFGGIVLWAIYFGITSLDMAKRTAKPYE